MPRFRLIVHSTQYHTNPSLPNWKQQPIETDLLEFLAPLECRHLSILEGYDNPPLNALKESRSQGDCYNKCHPPDKGLRNINPSMLPTRMLAPDHEPVQFSGSAPPFRSNITVELNYFTPSKRVCRGSV